MLTCMQTSFNISSNLSLLRGCPAKQFHLVELTLTNEHNSGNEMSYFVCSLRLAVCSQLEHGLKILNCKNGQTILQLACNDVHMDCALLVYLFSLFGLYQLKNLKYKFLTVSE